MTDSSSQSDEDFLKRLDPELEFLEKFRQENLSAYKLRKKAGIIIWLLAVPAIAYGDWILNGCAVGHCGETVSTTAKYCAILMVIIGWFVSLPKKQYTKAYKILILPRIAKLFGDFY